jgi:hypothetical protein
VFKRTSETNIEVSVRPPLIYLDHCAVRSISSEPKWRAHLRETFQTRGTLMFSVVNMLEMARNSGPSYERIRDLLDDLGPYWLPSDPDPGMVLAREQQGDVAPKSFFVPLDIFGPIFRQMPAGTFNLGAALEKLHDAQFRARAPDVLGNRPGFLKMLRGNRARHLAGEKFLPLDLPPHSIPWIEGSLIRLLVSDGKKIKENDAIDLLHAVVPLHYAIVLVFDKAWASFAKRLGLRDGTHVFDPTDRGITAALECIRTVDTSQHRVIRPEQPIFIR